MTSKQGQWHKARRSDPSRWHQHALVMVRCKCKRHGIPFDLDADYLAGLMPFDFCCPVLEVPFVFGRPDPYNPSIDRIDPKKGYVRGNVAIISYRANLLKSDASRDELEKVILWLDTLEFQKDRNRGVSS